MPKSTRNTIQRHSQRRGTTLVEFALVAMPLFLFFFACVEFGRGMMVVNTLEESARAGCRAAILNGAAESDIEAKVDEMMTLNGIDVYDLEYTPQSLAAAHQWDPITVRVSVNFEDVSWLPLPRALSGMQYSASSTLPKEAASIIVQ